MREVEYQGKQTTSSPAPVSSPLPSSSFLNHLPLSFILILFLPSHFLSLLLPLLLFFSFFFSPSYPSLNSIYLCLCEENIEMLANTHKLLIQCQAFASLFLGQLEEGLCGRETRNDREREKGERRAGKSLIKNALSLSPSISRYLPIPISLFRLNPR